MDKNRITKMLKVMGFASTLIFFIIFDVTLIVSLIFPTIVSWSSVFVIAGFSIILGMKFTNDTSNDGGRREWDDDHPNHNDRG